MNTISSTPAFVLSLSGGLDSTVLCAELLERHEAGSSFGMPRVLPVFFEYGSKHNAWEKKAALDVAEHYNLTLKIIDLTQIFSHTSSGLLSSDSRDIPRGAYGEDSMSLTVVPGRNLIFGSILAAIAESNGIPAVALATHSGDHHLYPDCRQSFNKALAEVVSQSSDGRVEVLTPFGTLLKKDIVAKGSCLKAPFHLTRTCYSDESTSCGVCGTCVERLEAFAANGMFDPITY